MSECLILLQALLNQQVQGLVEQDDGHGGQANSIYLKKYTDNTYRWFTTDEKSSIVISFRNTNLGHTKVNTPRNQQQVLSLSLNITTYQFHLRLFYKFVYGSGFLLHKTFYIKNLYYSWSYKQFLSFIVRDSAKQNK